MNEAEIRDTLRAIARTVVSNEVVMRHFLTQGAPPTDDEYGAKVRGVDAQIEDAVAQRFPALYPAGILSLAEVALAENLIRTC